MNYPISRQVSRAEARARPIVQQMPKVRRGPKPGHLFGRELINGYERVYHATKGYRWRRP